jgi:hypothetical protein
MHAATHWNGAGCGVCGCTNPFHKQAATARVYEVFSWRQDDVERTLTALAKRAAKRGLTPIAWAWGVGYEKKVGHTLPSGDTRTERVTCVPLTLVGEPPRYAGWRFVAALDHMDGENITRAVAGEDLPPCFRSVGGNCDHCKAARRRAHTYILRHEDGRVTQVGSTCIADFLGTDTADRLAASATYFADVRACAEDGECWGGGGHSLPTVAEYLGYVACCVRKAGWLSRTVARDRGEEGRSTADMAARYRNDPKARADDDMAPTADDGATAEAAEAWASALTDAEVDAAQGDYLHNVRAAVRSGLVRPKHMGIVASVVVAYQRAMGRARERAERAARPRCNEHVGEVGKRQEWAGLVLDFVTGYEGAYGYTTVLKFRDDAGRLLVWKASGISSAVTGVGVGNYSQADITRADVGRCYHVTGTVKKHDEYKGEKQTLLSRCIVSDAATVPPTPPKAPRKARAPKAAKALGAAVNIPMVPRGTRCADCGEPGYTTGHMECQYPQDRV